MKLTLDITGAGPAHCIAESLDRGHCPYLRTARFGSLWSCQVFRDRVQLKDSTGDGTGRLLRWPECVAAEDVAAVQRDTGSGGWTVDYHLLSEIARITEASMEDVETVILELVARGLARLEGSK